VEHAWKRDAATRFACARLIRDIEQTLVAPTVMSA